MCYWVRFWEDENKKVLREVPLHADTETDAMEKFQHDFPNIGRFELIRP